MCSVARPGVWSPYHVLEHDNGRNQCASPLHQDLTRATAQKGGHIQGHRKAGCTACSPRGTWSLGICEHDHSGTGIPEASQVVKPGARLWSSNVAAHLERSPCATCSAMKQTSHLEHGPNVVRGRGEWRSDAGGRRYGVVLVRGAHGGLPAHHLHAVAAGRTISTPSPQGPAPPPRLLALLLGCD